MKVSEGWQALQACTWYLHNKSFDEFFGTVFLDYQRPPAGRPDRYRTEWLERWSKRSLGAIFANLDFPRQRMFVAAVMDAYARDAEEAWTRRVKDYERV